MPKIDITRTELVWPGKYDDEGNLVPPRRVQLPFQVIERVNETRATRAQREKERAGHVGTLFDFWQADEAGKASTGDGWRNKLIWGDNLYVMSSLLEHFAGKVDLIYIDPPFATGADFSFTAQVGDGDLDITKEQSLIEEKAYRDTWQRGLASYLEMMLQRFLIMRDLLTTDGCLFVHIDWRVVHYLKPVLDEVFGQDAFVQELIWKHQIMGGAHGKRFPKAHETILWYANGSDYRLRKDDPLVRVPFSDYVMNSMQQDEDGRWFYTRRRMSRKATAEELASKAHTRTYVDDPSKGTLASDVWDDMLSYQPKPIDNEKYPTQKPNELLERIIAAACDPNSLVADFFAGSGTTCVVAEKLGRRWLGCDLSRYAVHTARKRLMNIPDCRPFEILNLGKYERQVWQGVTFGKKQKPPEQMLIFEYLKFILELYGAQPLPGTQYLHGKKGSAVVHVGAVDAPVTIDEVNACLAECKAMRQKELDILGWEWEMGLANLMVDSAKAQGVKLLLLNIPREVMEAQAVEKGDIHFYELAYLETDIQVRGRTATVKLTDLCISNDDLIPPEVRAKIKKWSDYVDYWAVDWDFRDDTFVNGWTSYRTRADRTLELKSEPHEYAAKGAYRILVKVIDIFGNDTSQMFQVKVE